MENLVLLVLITRRQHVRAGTHSNTTDKRTKPCADVFFILQYELKVADTQVIYRLCNGTALHPTILNMSLVAHYQLCHNADSEISHL